MSAVNVSNTISPVAAVASEKKVAVKKTIAKPKKPSTAPSHPPTQQMVDASIKSLKERGGSSLLAIKKYISATYKCDADKLAPFIKKYLKSSVVNGRIIQTKGKGASGSFKLSPAAIKEPKSKAAEKKPKVSKSTTGVAKKKKPLSSGKKVPSDKKIVKKAVSAKKPTAAVADKKKAADKAKVKSAKKSGVVKAKTSSKAKPSTLKPKASSAISKAKVSSSVTKSKKIAATSKKTSVAAKKPVVKK